MTAPGPVYWPDDPDAREIELFRGPLRLTAGGSGVGVVGVVYAAMEPSPGLWLAWGDDRPEIATFLLPALLGRDNDDVVVELVDPQFAATAFLGGPVPEEFRQFRTKVGGRLFETQQPNGQGLDRVVFHVINCHQWLTNVDLSSNGWEIEIRSPSSVNEVEAVLKARGGHAITRFGSLRRADGAAFDSSEAAEELEALQYFLTFVRGSWSSVVLPIGYLPDGSVGWEDWGSVDRRVSSWRLNLTWFNRTLYKELQGLFGSFRSRWARSYDRDVIRRVTEYMVGGNTLDTVNTRLLLAEAGLEAMAWVVLVETEGLLSRSQWKRSRDYPMSSKLRMLLSWAQIPANIPAGLPHLAAAARSEGWTDGPESLVKLRNSVVHPTKNLSALGSLHWSDGALLSMRYLEMVLLRWLDYSGEATNRLDLPMEPGKTEQVPWSP